MSSPSILPGGAARRVVMQGLAAGERRHAICGPAEALALVHDKLNAVEHALHRLVTTDVAALSHIANYLADAGGKRLRPALGALGALAIAVDPHVDLLAAGELVHLGSLLHDDVVDGARMRRGQHAAHVLHGNAASVLAGDFCTARALEAALVSGGLSAGLELARTVTEMSEGEVLQLQRAGQLSEERAAYLDIIDRKSASLIAWCASAPALAAGATREASRLAAYGRHVGRAYQIIDDILDYEDHTGKIAGADLLERKATLPLLYAFERVPGLRTRLIGGEPDPTDLPALIESVRASGALESARADARAYQAAALVALEDLPDSPARDALVVLADHIVERVV